MKNVWIPGFRKVWFPTHAVIQITFNFWKFKKDCSCSLYDKTIIHQFSDQSRVWKCLFDDDFLNNSHLWSSCLHTLKRLQCYRWFFTSRWLSYIKQHICSIFTFCDLYKSIITQQNKYAFVVNIKVRKASSCVSLSTYLLSCSDTGGLLCSFVETVIITQLFAQ